MRIPFLLAALLLAVFCARGADARPSAGVTTMRVSHLRTEYREGPLGLDAKQPRLSWTLTSRERGDAPTAFRILVASSPERLARGVGDMWDSGKVPGSAVMAVYAGKPLAARARYVWKVCAWDRQGRPSPWSAPAFWEMGLLAPSDWTARWIGRERPTEPQSAVVRFAPRRARYVRIRVTKLGIALPLEVEGETTPRPRLQLAEVECYGPRNPLANLAHGRPVAVSEKVVVDGRWDPPYLTDGRRTSSETPSGYSSPQHTSRDVSENPPWLEIDLGADAEISEVRLFPRTDYRSLEGGVPNFPTDYTIETRADGASEYETARTVTGQVPPIVPEREPLPLLAKDFTLERPVRRARLYVTGLGRYEARLNGHKVGNDELAPGDTDYRKEVAYATYDVTDSLKAGENTLGLMLGSGLYDLPGAPDRYQKLTNVWGTPRALALLVVEHPDGTITRIGTDGTWRDAPGPVLFSSHYGGEDYDARRELPGWDAPGYDRSGWEPVAVLGAPGAGPALVARREPPVRVVRTLKTVSVTQPSPGVWVFDLGQNFAGWAELRVSGACGQTVTMRPAELLDKAGRADQSNTGSPIFDTYTRKGEGVEVWHPRFMYHGFRYVEVTGLSGTPGPETVRGLVIRAANARHGDFACSNDLINRIHGLIDKATESNMMSVLTDCPHREKLGWLEVSHLMFEPITFHFDTTAWYEKLLSDMRDAQTKDGLVPDIAPEYTVFDGGFRDDPNWGGAAVFVPWYLYESTGDVRPLGAQYDTMRRYVDYLTRKADGHILSHGLGDWVAPDSSTPLPLVVTATYYRQARILAASARLLGKTEDAERYGKLGEEIAAAFEARFYHAETGDYGSGSQASNALALQAGLVPEARRATVLSHLAASVRKAGDHMTTGEVGLPAVLMSLMEGGENGLVYDFANLTTHPSYGYQVAHGATTLTELWDGPTAGWSQNHCMLGHIEQWFTEGLAGIRRTAPGWTALTIRPYVPPGMEWARASTETVRGRVASSWHHAADGTITLSVTVPVGSTATVYVPAASPDAVTEGGAPATEATGLRFLRMEDACAVYEAASGTYHFQSRLE